MDGLSGAASVIAVIDISAKIASLCYQYSVAVKDAKNDIARVQRKVSDITHILEKIKQLLDEGQKPDDSVEDATDDLAQSIHISFDPDVDAAGALHALDEELGNQSETSTSTARGPFLRAVLQ